MPNHLNPLLAASESQLLTKMMVLFNSGTNVDVSEVCWDQCTLCLLDTCKPSHSTQTQNAVSDPSKDQLDPSDLSGCQQTFPFQVSNCFVPEGDVACLIGERTSIQKPQPNSYNRDTHSLARNVAGHLDSEVKYGLLNRITSRLIPIAPI